MSNDNRSVLVYSSEWDEWPDEDYAERHEDDWWNLTGESGWPNDEQKFYHVNQGLEPIK